MDSAYELDLGAELRRLRAVRGLSLGDAAFRANLSKASVSNWESGTKRPRGAPLLKLLDVLNPDSRLRSRLIHAADPAYARIALVPTTLGAPIFLGQVIRAMRIRRGTTQAELARSVGVSQASVARWESGDSTPDGATVQSVCFALGASPEEASAVTCAIGGPAEELPDDPEQALESVGTLLKGPMDMQEVLALGFEASLWRQAARDPAWDPAYAYVVAHRALDYFLQGRLSEAEETARRALRIASTPQVRIEATVAVSALLEVATFTGADPATLAAKLKSWTDRLPDSHAKAWMMWERALRLAEMGCVDEAVKLTERMANLTSGLWQGTEVNLKASLAAAFLEVELRAGRPDRAEAHYLEHEQCPVPYKAHWPVRLAHARGKPADEAAFEAMINAPVRSREKHWYANEKLARIGREQARLMRCA